MKSIILTAGLAFLATSQAQITTISSPNFGGVTTITPTYQGYSYTTIGGPRSGDFGSVQVTGGNVTGVAVGPRGGTYPIVAPAVPPTQPQSILEAPIIPAASVPAPQYIPMAIPVPVSAAVPRHKPAPTATPYPKAKAAAETAEFNRLFAQVTDRKQFWEDFYRDWQIAPKTPVPLVYMIPYLRLWIAKNS